MINKIGGRKVFVCFVVLLSGVVLAKTGFLTSDLSNVLQAIVMAFAAGNVGEHAANAFRERSQPADAVDLSPVSDGIRLISAVQKEMAEKIGSQTNQGIEPTQVQALLNQGALTSRSLEAVLVKLDKIANKAGLGPL